MIIDFLFKIFKNKFLLAKIFFSLYNLLLIFLLNIFSDSVSSGNFLYMISLIQLFTSISRLGSDYYWVSSESDTRISIHERELIFQFLANLIFSLVFCYINLLFTFENFIVTFILFVFINLLQLFGRFYQKINFQILSLYLFTLGPTSIALPLYMLFDNVNHLYLLLVSSGIMLTPIIIISYKDMKFLVVKDTFFKRLNFFPMILFGFLNQNIISLLGGLTNNETSISILMLLQKITGFISWPLIFFLQKDLQYIKEMLKSKKSFLLGLKKYIFDNSLVFLMSSNSSLVLGIFILIYLNQFNFLSLCSLLLILFATLINSFFGFMQYQAGIKSQGISLFIVIVLGLLVSYLFSKMIDLNLVSVALSYFIFHLIIHFLNFFLLVRKFNV